MNYPNTIRLLKSEIKKMQKVVSKRQSINPEMNADLVWAQNDIEAANARIKEHQDVIELLLKVSDYDAKNPEQLLTAEYLIHNEGYSQTNALLLLGYCNNNGVRYVNQLSEAIINAWDASKYDGYGCDTPIVSQSTDHNQRFFEPK